MDGPVRVTIPVGNIPDKETLTHSLQQISIVSHSIWDSTVLRLWVPPPIEWSPLTCDQHLRDRCIVYMVNHPAMRQWLHIFCRMSPITSLCVTALVVFRCFELKFVLYVVSHHPSQCNKTVTDWPIWWRAKPAPGNREPIGGNDHNIYLVGTSSNTVSRWHYGLAGAVDLCRVESDIWWKIQLISVHCSWFMYNVTMWVGSVDMQPFIIGGISLYGKWPWRIGVDHSLNVKRNVNWQPAAHWQTTTCHMQALWPGRRDGHWWGGVCSICTL